MQLEKLFKEREKVLRELEHAEAVLEQSKEKDGGDGVRPTHRIGFMGCTGPKVDTIDYLKNRSGYLTNQFEEERKHVLQTEKSNTAFVIFNNRRSAAQASQVRSSSFLRSIFWFIIFAFISSQHCIYYCDAVLESVNNLACGGCCRLYMDISTRIGP